MIYNLTLFINVDLDFFRCRGRFIKVVIPLHIKLWFINLLWCFCMFGRFLCRVGYLCVLSPPQRLNSCMIGIGRSCVCSKYPILHISNFIISENFNTFSLLKAVLMSHRFMCPFITRIHCFCWLNKSVICAEFIMLPQTFMPHTKWLWICAKYTFFSISGGNTFLELRRRWMFVVILLCKCSICVFQVRFSSR